MSTDPLQEEFPQDPDILYLNHAAVAPWPLRATRAVQAFAAENSQRGAAGYAAWLRCEQALRRQLRELIHARSVDEIALVKNTSEALSFVAHGLDWQAGDNVVTTDLEFPSNRIVWESLARYGVEARIAPVAGAGDPEAALLECLDARTRLLAVSSVQYGAGLRMDLGRLGTACRARGVLFCVDAIQSIGALRFDVQDIHADFAMADGHKWMLGPEGLGLFYVRSEIMEQLTLHEYGWHMVEDQGNYDRTDWEVAHGARRFECGSGNLMAAHALSASLSLLLETGMDEVERRVLGNRGRLQERLARIAGVEIVSPTDPARGSGIVTFRVAGKDHQALHEALRDRGVVCAKRGGGIRYSPHYYLPEARLDAALGITEHLLK